jgi:hypothetical protein
MEYSQVMLNVIIGMAILLGIVQCFLGYRIFSIIIGLTGFLLGVILGSAIGFAVFQEEVAALISGIVGGFIGAALMMTMYYFGVFAIGALLGIVLGTSIFAVSNSNAEPVVLFILALIGGVIAIIIQRFMIVLSTSFGGSWIVVTGIAYFTTDEIDPTNLGEFFRTGGTHLNFFLICWIALGIVGVIVQIKSLPSKEVVKKKNVFEQQATQDEVRKLRT